MKRRRLPKKEAPALHAICAGISKYIPKRKKGVHIFSAWYMSAQNTIALVEAQKADNTPVYIWLRHNPKYDSNGDPYINCVEYNGNIEDITETDHTINEKEIDTIEDRTHTTVIANRNPRPVPEVVKLIIDYLTEQ